MASPPGKLLPLPGVVSPTPRTRQPRGAELGCWSCTPTQQSSGQSQPIRSTWCRKLGWGIQNAREELEGFAEHQPQHDRVGRASAGSHGRLTEGRPSPQPRVITGALCCCRRLVSQQPSSRRLSSVPRITPFPFLPCPLSHTASLLQRERNQTRAKGQSVPEQGAKAAPSCTPQQERARGGGTRACPSCQAPEPRAAPPDGHSQARKGLATRQVPSGSLEKQPVLNPCQTTKSHSEPAVPGKRRNLQTTEPLSTCFLEGRSLTTSQPGRHLLSRAPGGG